MQQTRLMTVSKSEHSLNLMLKHVNSRPRSLMVSRSEQRLNLMLRKTPRTPTTRFMSLLPEDVKLHIFKSLLVSSTTSLDPMPHLRDLFHLACTSKALYKLYYAFMSEHRLWAVVEGMPSPAVCGNVGCEGIMQNATGLDQMLTFQNTQVRHIDLSDQTSGMCGHMLRNVLENVPAARITTLKLPSVAGAEENILKSINDMKNLTSVTAFNPSAELIDLLSSGNFKFLNAVNFTHVDEARRAQLPQLAHSISRVRSTPSSIQFSAPADTQHTKEHSIMLNVENPYLSRSAHTDVIRKQIIRSVMELEHVSHIKFCATRPCLLTVNVKLCGGSFAQFINSLQSKCTDISEGWTFRLKTSKSTKHIHFSTTSLEQFIVTGASRGVFEALDSRYFTMSPLPPTPNKSLS